MESAKGYEDTQDRFYFVGFLCPKVNDREVIICRKSDEYAEFPEESRSFFEDISKISTYEEALKIFNKYDSDESSIDLLEKDGYFVRIPKILTVEQFNSIFKSISFVSTNGTKTDYVGEALSTLVSPLDNSIVPVPTTIVNFLSISDGSLSVFEMLNKISDGDDEINQMLIHHILGVLPETQRKRATALIGV